MHMIKGPDDLNPYPHMRGPCGPRKTLPGGPAVFFGTPEPSIQQWSHGLHTFQTTLVSFWGQCGPRRH